MEKEKKRPSQAASGRDGCSGGCPQESHEAGRRQARHGARAAIRPSRFNEVWLKLSCNDCLALIQRNENEGT